MLKSKGFRGQVKGGLIHILLTFQWVFSLLSRHLAALAGIGITDNPCTIMGIKNIFIVQASASFIFVMQINKKIGLRQSKKGMGTIFITGYCLWRQKALA
ncbi:hypothetical protein AB6V67_16550 [Serratia marcescens]|uniref:hypothetical protein n=1 Tax=Serratia TaxID=613 RepID=UPI0012B09907|nr:MULTISPECIES: hypothetical protein [Serratia]EIU0884903.1 hypothetical protein [Serratia marcescens]MEC5685937.1 hypothetical protein [Serratia nevei]MEC6068937.1 hypothetical protein [Serratia nevei]HAT4992723.1 hypothetical protein [Serratia marcescens]HAU4400677.1 hypothetical protein [Serratia marcescens]